tara:strand:+ start:396 stop:623 length:228 start_codon:yes stop_codon:yes gene_type:complete
LKKVSKIRPIKKLRFTQSEAVDIAREVFSKNTLLKKNYNKARTYDIDRYIRKLETLEIDIENALNNYYLKAKKRG